jgi:hypothetical protein
MTILTLLIKRKRRWYLVTVLGWTGLLEYSASYIYVGNPRHNYLVRHLEITNHGNKYLGLEKNNPTTLFIKFLYFPRQK